MSTYEISKSSLLSLKAEILRKQEELVKTKVENEQKARNIKKNTPLEFKNKGVEERTKNDLSCEEQDLLKLSNSQLEKKAALYEKLSKNPSQIEGTKNQYLVQFDKKHTNLETEDDEERHHSDEYEPALDSSEEWVEYVDCLGRTRTCLRKDLDYLLSKDADLKVIAESRKQVPVQEKEEINKDEINVNEEENSAPKEAELISGDMRRDMLRRQWEREEEDLRNKADIHYQNVLFNEARTHGVGYYSFSKDEEERAKQLEALKQLRKETKEKQRKAQDLRALREKQLAARMRAAKNRKRARMGLPPEEEEAEEQPSIPPDAQEDLNTEEKKKAEETEKLLEEARKNHVRPWDIGKDGVKEHYEMTQHEWNEKQRKERNPEFAPPSTYKKRAFESNKPLEVPGEQDRSLKFTSKRKKHLNPYRDSDDDVSDSIEAGLKFLRKQAEERESSCESSW